MLELVGERNEFGFLRDSLMHAGMMNKYSLEPAEKTDKIAWHTMQVLVADDSKDMRQLIKDMLKEIGVKQIFEAEDGREALRRSTQTGEDRPDIIVCDWDMPHLSGIDLLRELRKNTSHQIFVMATSHKDVESVKLARAAGVDGYIIKPFSANQLRNKIVSILTQRHG